MISIIVTSYSSERLDDIRDLFESFKLQSDPDFEVVYITERDDYLREYVSKLMKESNINGKVVHNTGPRGLSEARNLGIVKAKGDLIAFVDDDVVLDPQWTMEVKDAFGSLANIAGATGPAFPKKNGEQANWVPVQFDWLIGSTRWFQSEKSVEIRNCWGMNMCFDREAMERTGPFSTQTGYTRGKLPEDVEDSLRMKNLTGKKMYYVPEMKVFNSVHRYRFSAKFIIERSSWIAHTRRQIDNNQMEKDLLRTFPADMHKIVSPAGLTGEEYFARLRLVILSFSSMLIGYWLGTVRV